MAVRVLQTKLLCKNCSAHAGKHFPCLVITIARRIVIMLCGVRLLHALSVLHVVGDDRADSQQSIFFAHPSLITALSVSSRYMNIEKLKSAMLCQKI